ncbi:uncharacterized protein LOC108919163 [Arapaima gigas]
MWPGVRVEKKDVYKRKGLRERRKSLKTRGCAVESKMTSTFWELVLFSVTLVLLSVSETKSKTADSSTPTPSTSIETSRSTQGSPNASSETTGDKQDYGSSQTPYLTSHVTKTRDNTSKCNCTNWSQNTGFKTEDLKMIAAFMIGAFVSGSICLVFFSVICLCQRQKEKRMAQDEEKNETNYESIRLIAINEEQVPDVQEENQDQQIPLSGPSTMAENEEPYATADTGTGPKEDVAKDVDYATINYSMLKEREEGAGEEGGAETEYAEIKQEVTAEVSKEAEEQQLTEETEEKLDKESQEQTAQEDVQ